MFSGYFGKVRGEVITLWPTVKLEEVAYEKIRKVVMFSASFILVLFLPPHSRTSPVLSVHPDIMAYLLPASPRRSGWEAVFRLSASLMRIVFPTPVNDVDFFIASNYS